MTTGNSQNITVAILVAVCGALANLALFWISAVGLLGMSSWACFELLVIFFAVATVALFVAVLFMSGQRIMLLILFLYAAASTAFNFYVLLQIAAVA